MVVLPDADLDLAADAAVNAGFGSAGERCMAISVVVAVDPVGDRLVEAISERVNAFGSATAGAADMGPLVTAAHRDRVASYLEAGVAGAQTGRRRHARAPAGDPEGFWLGPTLFDRVTPDMSLYTDEIFGPVLSVVRSPSYEAALELVNANPYGNGTAIFTNDGGAARRFQTEVEVGMVGVNVPIPVPMAYYSFGGWKASLFGDAHAHGTEGVSFFTRGKVVTSRWLDPDHGGIDLGFPRTADDLHRPNRRAGRRRRHADPRPDPARGREVYDLDRAYVFHSWSAQARMTPLVLAGAQGSFVWDYEGNRYLDFSSQMVNTNIGHQHPVVVEAIREQAARLCTIAPQHANDQRSEAARRIVDRSPIGEGAKVFFTNAGAEAVEHAVRMARLHTGRPKVLATYRSYHGATGTAINLTGDARRWPSDTGTAVSSTSSDRSSTARRSTRARPRRSRRERSTISSR